MGLVVVGLDEGRALNHWVGDCGGTPVASGDSVEAADLVAVLLDGGGTVGAVPVFHQSLVRGSDVQQVCAAAGEASGVGGVHREADAARGRAHSSGADVPDGSEREDE